MKFMNKYVIKVLATGFVALVILSILLFWARRECQAVFYDDLMGDKVAQVNIQPSGLLPRLDSAPEILRKSSIENHIEADTIAYSLGVLRDFSRLDSGRFGEFSWLINRDEKKGIYNLILFDKNLGLFVFYDVFRAQRGWDRKVKLYAGPKGVSETAGKQLGRFSQPRSNLWRIYGDSLTFFDKEHSCFFQISFSERNVTKSSHFSEVIKVGGFAGFSKDVHSIQPSLWSPPLREQTPLDKENREKIRGSIQGKDGAKINLVSAAEKCIGPYSTEDLLFLESNGTIRRLNCKTLEISKHVGFLPSAVVLGGRAKPKDLYGYSVQPFTIDGEYSGTIAASISREILEMQVMVFDKDGNLIKRERAEINPFSIAGGPAVRILNYLLENLQPAFFGMVSYFTASDFDAIDGYTGLLILPNSVVARFGREAEGIVAPFFGAIIMISPSIILGLLLGLVVYKDATVAGASKKAKRYWLWGTILFGLSAYIAYRLTKPKETLVTCQNCGKMRRPDMTRCHRCGSKWQVPELTPPAWRIIIKPDKKVAG